MAPAAKPSAGKPAAPTKRVAGAARSGPVRRGGRVDAATIAEIFKRFAAAEPEPKGELEHSNPFTLLVAVVLSAQATDAGVNKATRGLFAFADTPEKMVALGEDRVREAIKTIGLFRNKAKNIKAASQRLIDPRIFNDKTIYPDEATLSRLFVITARDPATQRIINRLWTRVKTGK